MITNLELYNFRNHAHLKIDLSSGLNIICGPNGSGKTNILEAIYVACLTKSFRAADLYLLNQDADFFRILTSFVLKKPVHTELRYSRTGNSSAKTLLLENKKQSLKSFITKQPVVLFEPNHIQLIDGLPAVRRKYLDEILSQIQILYLKNHQIYTRLLKQRNSLLFSNKKSPSPLIHEQLFVYSIQMKDSAEYIARARREIIDKIIPILQEKYREISKTDSIISLQPILCDTQDYIEKCEQNLAIDIASARTNYGPHRDDFTFYINNNKLQQHASRGEVRSVVLALKATEIELLLQLHTQKPLLLFDDVLSELDKTRQASLLAIASKFQTILTCTELNTNNKLAKNIIQLPL